MRSKERDVIKLLLEKKDTGLSISQIAKLLKKDYKNVHNIIKRLEKASIIKLEPFGKSYQVTLVNKIHPLIFEAEYLRRKELLKNKNILVMLDYFKNLKTKLYVLLIFGSYAKKTYTKHSDIDLLFIVPDSREVVLEKEIHSIARTLPLPLHINVFKESDFTAMKNLREVTVGQEAIKHNVILYGIEAYYEIIQ